MNQLIYTNDFLFHSFDNEPTCHKWILNLLKPVIKNAVNCQFVEFSDLSGDTEKFSRKKFFDLSGISNPSFSYFNYELEAITDASIEYLKTFVSPGSFVFGVELSENLRKILHRLNCKFINIAFHSFKLFDDIPLLFNTNDESIYGILNKYKIPKEKFEFYANYWKVFFEENNFTDKSISKKSVVFIGQTMKDMSVEHNGKFLSVLDYGDYLLDLCKKYNQVYYLPHPRLEKKKFFKKFLKQYKNLSILENTNVYTLLANPNVAKIVGISSSVLYEAQFFNKETEYLLHPLYNIDSAFDFNAYISIYNEFFIPSFWQEILKGFYEIKEIACDENFFIYSKNKMRNLKDLYWAFGDLDDGQNLKKYVKSKLKKIKYFAFENTKKHFIFHILGINFRIRKYK